MHRLPASSGLLLLVGIVLASACTVTPGDSGGGTVFGADSGVPDVSSGSSGSSGAGSSGSSSGSLTNDASDVCEPGNVATYHPDAYHPASGLYQGRCVPDSSGDPITQFYDQCLGSTATNDDCNQFKAAHADCVACILTPDTAAKYGPILDHSTFVTANVAGCIELAGDEEPDASEVPCAEAVQALAGCELAACEANCAVHDGASLAAYDTCATDAEGGGCEEYATGVTCVEALGEASTLGAGCLGDFETFYQVVVPTFCGPPPADAGGGQQPQPTPDAGHE